MDEFWKIAVSVAGLGAIATFFLWSLYRNWLKLPIFQKLTKAQQYNLFILFFILSFLFSIGALVSYTFLSYYSENEKSSLYKNLGQMLTIISKKFDEKGVDTGIATSSPNQQYGEEISDRIAILAVHDFGNKPQLSVLKQNWIQSIEEGLNRIRSPVEFDLFMADFSYLMYKHELHSDELFATEVYYDTEPYTPAESEDYERYNRSFLDRIRGISTLGILDPEIMKKLKPPLEAISRYFDPDTKARDSNNRITSARSAIIREVKALLEKVSNTYKGKVILIGHGTGAVALFDTLYDLENTNPELKIPILVTLGTPLGLPHIKLLFNQIYNNERLKTPEAISEHWVNFSDENDVIAIDSHLRDDYGASSNGVKADDYLVVNNYKLVVDGSNLRNRNKAYGYLRTPEFSETITKYIRSLEKGRAEDVLNGSNT